jgi:anaerobic magnesium-protoporphyrin IX monomethyl ester cyclase
MKVILVNPPLRTNVPATLYPVGICYVASYLRENGHKVQVLDINGYRWTKQEFIKVLERQSFEAVGIGGLVTAFNHVEWISHHIKSIHPDVPVFAGNTVASTIPHILLRHTDVDIAVIGEGEYTALDLVNTLENGDSLAQVKGIWYKAPDGKIIENPRREPIESLDSLPLPAYDLVPMEIYLRNFEREFGFRGAALSTVRGCPFNCRFCCKTFMGYKVRSRSPENVVAELEAWIQKYHVNGFLLCDDTFIYNRKRTVDFCNLLIDRRLNYLKWIVSARVELLTEELATKMKEAGCIHVGFGFESHSQKVLDYYNKRNTVEDQQRAIDICRKAGLKFQGSYIVGAANEDESTLQETRDFASRNNLSYTPDHLLMPQPQTPIYDECVQRGLIKDELEYIKKMSDAGDTDVFVVNLTHFPDSELLRMFSKYRHYGQIPSQRLKLIVKNPMRIPSKIKERGLQYCVNTLLKRILLRKDLQAVENLKYQPRNIWV